MYRESNIHQFREPIPLREDFPGETQIRVNSWLLPLFGFLAVLLLMWIHPMFVYAMPFVGLMAVVFDKSKDFYGFIFIALLPLSITRYFFWNLGSELPTITRVAAVVIILTSLLHRKVRDSDFSATGVCWAMFVLVLLFTTGIVSTYPNISYIKLFFFSFLSFLCLV